MEQFLLLLYYCNLQPVNFKIGYSVCEKLSVYSELRLGENSCTCFCGFVFSSGFITRNKPLFGLVSTKIIELLIELKLIVNLIQEFGRLI